MPSKLAEAYIAIRGDLSQLLGDLGRARSMVSQAFSGLAGGAGGAASGIAGFFRNALSVTVGVLIRDAVHALKDALLSLGRAFISTNADMERYQTSLGVMLKSHELGVRFVGEVQEMARKTPFSTEALIRGTTLLKIYGFNLQKLLPMMRSIGDAAAASPQGMEFAIHRISLAIGQMRSAGKLMGQDMKQLTEVGVPVNEILKKHFKMAIPDLQEAIKSGAITMASVIDAILGGMDQRFGGMMEKIAGTFGGLMERVKDTALIAIRKIGEPIFELAKVSLKGIAAFLDSGQAKVLTETFRTTASLVAEIARNFGRLLPTVEGAGAGLKRIMETANELLDWVSLLTMDFEVGWEFVKVAAQAAFSAIGGFIAQLGDEFASVADIILQVFGEMVTKIAGIAGRAIVNQTQFQAEQAGADLAYARSVDKTQDDIAAARARRIESGEFDESTGRFTSEAAAEKAKKEDEWFQRRLDTAKRVRDDIVEQSGRLLFGEPVADGMKELAKDLADGAKEALETFVVIFEADAEKLKEKLDELRQKRQGDRALREAQRDLPQREDLVAPEFGADEIATEEEAAKSRRAQFMDLVGFSKRLQENLISGEANRAEQLAKQQVEEQKKAVIGLAKVEEAVRGLNVGLA